MSGFPTVPSRDAVGQKWDMGSVVIRQPKEEVSDAQLNLLAWQTTGLGVGVACLVWILINGTTGALISSGECFNPNGNTALKPVSVTAWQGSTAYAIGTVIANSGNLYKATAQGTSASSGGPTGTGGSITDGSVTWAFQSTGGYCQRLSTGVYQVVYQALYNDETGTLVPFALTVAGAEHQTTDDYRTAKSVSGSNVVEVHVRNSSGTPVDANVLIWAR